MPVKTTPVRTHHQASGSSEVIHKAATQTIIETTPTAARPKPAIRTWTYYNVNVRIGPTGHPSAHVDIPRFTPLPKASTPRAMYAGVAADGGGVIFSLQAGVTAHGPGLCRPDRARCSAIVLPVNRAERLTFTDTVGKTRTLILKASKMRAHETHSKSQEQAALNRKSADGTCELALGHTVSSQDSLTATARVSGPCREAKDLVAFPGTASAS
jgi:hypothetical protein